MKALFVSLFVLCFTSPLFAGTVTALTNSGSPGEWSDGGTWSGGAVPQSGDAVLIPAGKAVVVAGQVYATPPFLHIDVLGTLNFEPSGKLTLSLLSYLRIIVGGKIVPKNSAASQLIVIGGVIKYNAANNGTINGPAIADALSGVSLPGLPTSGFMPWALPVTLTSFTAEASVSGFVLHWQTAAESNMERFVLERSSDGGASFVLAGSLAAKGSPSAYSLVDVFAAGGEVLYRLKMVEKSGRIAYSGSLRETKVATAGIGLWPNPASSCVNVSFPFSWSGNLTVRVQNAAGVLVKTAAVDGAGGRYQFSVAGFAKGNYLLVVEKGVTLLNRQFFAVQ